MSDPTKVLAITGALMSATSGPHLCEMLHSLGVKCLPTADGNVWWHESNVLIRRGACGWALENDLSRTSLAVEATARTLANWCGAPIQTPKCVTQASTQSIDEMAEFLRAEGVHVMVYPATLSIECKHTRWTLTSTGWVVTLAPWFSLPQILLLERWCPPPDSF